METFVNVATGELQGSGGLRLRLESEGQLREMRLDTGKEPGYERPCHESQFY